ncbi:hypothetical protein [Castellaniella sp.]|uniref:hypothetical protein n=1 Tax=Castellaniella sp. TaxID=1955812 RepID=UPI002AFF6BCB|nr:hypothetical protein [Castellaniella sp.]
MISISFRAARRPSSSSAPCVRWLAPCTMPDFPNCPECAAQDTYQDGEHYICPHCAHEWSAEATPAIGGLELKKVVSWDYWSTESGRTSGTTPKARAGASSARPANTATG